MTSHLPVSVAVRTAEQAARQCPPGSRRSNPDVPATRVVAGATRRAQHPACPPHDHRVRRHGSLPGGRERSRPRRVGNPAPAGAFCRSCTLPPPLAAAPAHFPLWAVAAMVAATVVPSAASTLFTLSLEYMRRDRRKPAAAAETPPRAREPPAPTPETGTSRDPQQRPPDGRPRPATSPRRPPCASTL